MDFVLNAVEFQNLTRIGHNDECRVLEAAVPAVPACSLVVEIHGDGRVRREGIGVKARTFIFQYTAVHLRACIVQVLP